MSSFTVQEEWQEILRATSPEAFRDGTPSVEYLQDGQEFLVVIETEWWAPIPPFFFDLWFAEEFLNAFIDVGGRIIDVSQEGWHTIKIRARADASVASTATQIGPLFVVPVIPITTAISVAIIAIGLATAISLMILFRKISGGTADLIGMVVTVMIVVLMMSLLGKQLLPKGEEEARG